MHTQGKQFKLVGERKMGTNSSNPFLFYFSFYLVSRFRFYLFKEFLNFNKIVFEKAEVFFFGYLPTHRRSS